MAPYPETTDEAAPGLDRRGRVVPATLVTVVLLAAFAGVGSLRQWQLPSDTGQELQRHFDEFHLEDRFQRVAEDTSHAGRPQAPDNEVRLARVYRTDATPDDATAQLRSALRSAGLASDVLRRSEDELVLASAQDLQGRGRQVNAVISRDPARPGAPTMVRITLSAWP